MQNINNYLQNLTKPDDLMNFTSNVQDGVESADLNADKSAESTNRFCVLLFIFIILPFL